MSGIVGTQDELDAALAAEQQIIEIDSVGDLVIGPRPLSLLGGGLTVHLRGASSLTAAGGIIMAHDQSAVRCGPDAVVTATDSASVRGSGVINAGDRASVQADGSASVSAWGNCRVRLAGAASLTAHDEVTVLAEEESRVRATDLVRVRLRHDALCRVETLPPDGGVAITGEDAVITPQVGMIYGADGRAATLDDADTWCRWGHVDVTDGIAWVHKAVDAFWTTPWAVRVGVFYRPGTCPTSPDWDPSPQAGSGLHFSPTPFQARQEVRTCTHVVRAGVLVDELVPVGESVCRVPRVVGPCQKVDE